MDQRIINFLTEQTVATICCTDEENKPYCFSCFYALDAEKNQLYFKSPLKTHHSSLLMKNTAVAGTIQPDSLNKLAIQGIQFKGSMVSDDGADATRIYYSKYPFAIAMAGELWIVQLEYVKMTDNTLLFGKKITWQLSDEEICV